MKAEPDLADASLAALVDGSLPRVALPGVGEEFIVSLAQHEVARAIIPNEMVRVFRIAPEKAMRTAGWLQDVELA